jgi:hypothetical protein
MLGFPKLQGEMILEESKPQNSQVKMTATTIEAMELAPTALKSLSTKSLRNLLMLKKVATTRIKMFRLCG